MSAVALPGSVPTLAERVRNLLETADYRLAISDGDREAVYRLRYDAYLWEQAIAPNFGRRLSDKFDDLDNSWVFGIFVEDRLASSIRITVASAGQAASPAIEAFPDVLAREVGAGKVIIDPTRFVVSREFSRLYPDLRYATTRIAWMACDFFGADLLLASVRTEHQAFYRRYFGHEVVCAAREYPTLIKPLSLMVCDFERQRATINQRYPFFRSTLFERRMLFEPGLPAVRWAAREPRIAAVSSLAS